MPKKLLQMLLMTALCAAHLPVLAVPIAWTDWTAATTGSAGSATGIMGGITVSYTGDVTFAQLGGSGTNYWSEGTPAPYTGNSTVDNAPIPVEMIAMSLTGITNTVTFSQAVLNPIMAIVSQGQPNYPVSYDFNTPFTVLGEGRGYWGDGTYQTLPGDILKGYELHGVIQFNGFVSSLSWVASPNEYWHGFTMGIPPQTSVPEPTTLALVGLGLAGLGFSKRRKL